jgi:transcription initiation factor IIF auxiliary subunit
MRSWEISIYLVGQDGEELAANCYEKATYMLHESFGKRMKQTFKSPPFQIKEKGWGEFDMTITLTPIGSPKGGDQTIQHDLNFQQERYESTHSVVCITSRREWLAEDM